MIVIEMKGQKRKEEKKKRWDTDQLQAKQTCQGSRMKSRLCEKNVAKATLSDVQVY